MGLNRFRSGWIAVASSLLLMAACGGGSGGPSRGSADAGAPGADLQISGDLPPSDLPERDGAAGGDGVVGDPGSGDGGGIDPGSDLPRVDAGPSPGEPGYPCTSNEQCLTPFCVEGPDEKTCARPCIDSCPEDWLCSQVTGVTGDTLFICIFPFLNLCRPCTGSEVCSPANATGGGCVDFGNAGSFCGISCAAGKSCPEGFVCAGVPLVEGGTAQQCVPEGGECTCSSKAVQQGATTTCYEENASGKCLGARACSEEGLSACNAPVPEEEVCGDGVDNDCDDQTDEDGAKGCVTYYADNDEDGFGLGSGTCLCTDPGKGFVTKGGDCNDLTRDVNPDAEEWCNGIDDNCNDAKDEVGAKGCVKQWVDADKDGHGNPDLEVCACGATEGFSSENDDCDDSDGKVSPSAKELCQDGVDNDCNGQTDEETAQGCIVYYLDGDDDGFGLDEVFQCLCGPDGLYRTELSGDCNDADPGIKPFAPEVCDGVDNDCDDKIDESEVASLCPEAPHATLVCNKGCLVESCQPKWHDVNGDPFDGCECKQDANEGSGNLCTEARDLGSLVDQAAQSQLVTGNIAPAGDSDWYKVRAVDVADTSCDNFHFSAVFKTNPSDAYVFDVFRGSCLPADQECSAAVTFNHAVDFADAESKTGQCPCSPVVTTAADAGCIGDCAGFPRFGEPGKNFCGDDSADFYIRVYLRPDFKGLPPCEPYELQVSNGVAKTAK